MKWHTKQAHPSVAKCPEGTIPVRRDYATSDDNTNDAREVNYTTLRYNLLIINCFITIVYILINEAFSIYDYVIYL